jgi:mRNA-degrading endonuclease toxin of MazEF toxin-antitoxin module
MRRSTRIRWQIPIQITSVDSRVPFNETCETVAVNAHGCGVICHTPLEKGTPVKLGLLPDNREVMAHIADVVKLGEDGRAWLLGLQLDVAANVWGVRNPPHDWDKPSAGQEPEAAAAPLAASAAAGAGASGAAVSTATLAAPEFSIVSPAPPANPPVVVQSVAVAEPPKVDVAKPATTANNNGSGQRATDVGRGDGAQAGVRSAFGVRDRDWADLRKQMEEHLQDLMWQVDDQVETKLEHWKEQMVDAEARLESLCQLQDRLQAHITVLSEIVKEKVKPEEQSGASPAATAKPETTATTESEAVTASQVEEIRQLQQWMQSLIHLLPQAVEQHASEAVSAAEQRLHGQAEEQFNAMRKQLAELQERLEAPAAGQKSPAESEAAEEVRRKASEEALRAAGEALKESLQKSLREESEKLQQELKQSQQAAQEEAERLRKLQEEVAARAAQHSDEAGHHIEQLKATETAVRGMGEQLRAELRSTLQSDLDAQKQQLQQALAAVAAQHSEEAAQQGEHLQAAQKTVREIGERLRSELHATIQAELESQKQQIGQTAAAVEEKSTRLQTQMNELTAGTEEARRAREALESVVASLTQAASQQIQEDVATGLQTISGEAQQQAQRRDKEFAEKLAEAQRLGTAAQEQLAQLAKQASELSARLDEGQRSREALQARLESAVRTAEQKVESSAAGILRQVGSQTEQEIKRLEEQVTAQQKKLDELTQQRQQELQLALDTHMVALRSSSESMLRKVSDELRGSLNTHLKEEFASQRHIWEKQREASQAEKTWVETRANELAGRWEARLQGYIERATGDAVNKLRTDVEKAAADIIREQMEAVEKRLSGSLEPLLARAEGTNRGLEKLLASVQKETQRAEAQNAAFQRQRDDAEGWMEQQMERLRQAVHDAVVETSGEIKGRIHMAVEMAREPIEQRSREAQRQVEELAERKSREMTDRLTEFEKAMSPRLQAHLTEAMGKFQKDTDELAKKSVQRCQEDLAETLDSMLHLVRGKRESKSK